MRQFPAPWTVEKLDGDFKVVDANGQSLAYVYYRDGDGAAAIAKVLTEDEARRIAANIAIGDLGGGGADLLSFRPGG